MGFWIGLVLFVAALYFLLRLKDKDLAAAAAATGLTRVTGAPVVQATTPEGWPCRDVVIASGDVGGRRVSLISRTMPKAFTPKADRIASQFTVIALHLSSSPPAVMQLQPVGWTRTIASLTHTPPPVVPTGDDACDAVWHVHTDVPRAALLMLAPAVRDALVTFRNTHVPDGPAWTQRANAALLLGSFRITADVAEYSVFGSPTAKTGAHVMGALPLLTRLSVPAST